MNTDNAGAESKRITLRHHQLNKRDHTTGGGRNEVSCTVVIVVASYPIIQRPDYTQSKQILKKKKETVVPFTELSLYIYEVQYPLFCVSYPFFSPKHYLSYYARKLSSSVKYHIMRQPSEIILRFYDLTIMTGEKMYTGRKKNGQTPPIGIIFTAKHTLSNEINEKKKERTSLELHG